MGTMAPYGWGKAHSVGDWLFAEGYRFDFFQAVRLLEWIYPPRNRIGATSDPSGETLRFRSTLSFGFPASDLERVDRPVGKKDPAEMVINFLSLGGVHGPLPWVETERILASLSRKDFASRDFLDIFHHRLASLVFRVRKTFRVGIDIESPEQGQVARCLFALVGLGSGGMRNRMQIADRSLLYYAGPMVGEARSMAGLTGMLRSYFDIEVKGEPFVGGWYDLDDEQHSILGDDGRNTALSAEGVTLGRRVWDQQAKFELLMGPLTYEKFLELLPNGRGVRALNSMTRFYAGPTLEFQYRFLLRPDQVPASTLSATDGARLGWNSWVLTKPWSEKTPEVVLSPEQTEKTLSALPASAREAIQPPPLPPS